MLERLDQIDWKGIDAEIVPEIVRGYLQGRNLDDQSILTYERLFFLNSAGEPLVHELEFQSNFPDRKVIALLVPLLIELLQLPLSQVDPVKTNLLWDLDFIAGYVDYTEGRPNHALHHAYAIKLRNLVWQGHGTYFTFLTSKESKEKMAALHLLSQFHEHADIVLPHLQGLLQAETTTWRVEIMQTISEKLLRSNSAKKAAQCIIQDELIIYLNEDHQHAIRIAAFSTLVEILEAETPSNVIDVMLQYFTHQGDKMKALLKSNLFAGRLLMRLGAEKGIDAAIWTIDRSPNTTIKFSAVYAALLLAFDPDFDPDGFGVYSPEMSTPANTYYSMVTQDMFYKAPTDLDNLTAVQRRVLKIMVEKDWIWRHNTNFNAKFGLPDEREALRQLLN